MGPGTWWLWAALAACVGEPKAEVTSAAPPPVEVRDAPEPVPAAADPAAADPAAADPAEGTTAEAAPQQELQTLGYTDDGPEEAIGYVEHDAAAEAAPPAGQVPTEPARAARPRGPAPGASGSHAVPAPKSVTIDGRAVSYVAPANPVGIIYLFHGSGGSGSSWFTNTEQARFTKDAASRGYVLVAPDSADRTNKKWDRSIASSKDVAFVKQLDANLPRVAHLPANLPVYGVGMSDGGGFVPLVGTQLHFDAIVISHAAGHLPLFEHTHELPPTLWITGPNDQTVPTAKSNAGIALARQTGAEIKLASTHAQPVTIDLVERIPGITPRQAGQIVEVLKAGKVVAADGRIQVSTVPERKIVERKLEDKAKGLGAFAPGVVDLLLMARGDHKFTSDMGGEILSWLGAHR